MVPVLLVLINFSGVVNQVSMAVHTLLLIAGPGINNRPMGQHGAAFVRDIKKVAVTFLALLVLKGGISRLSVFIMIVGVLGKMNNNVFHAMHGLGVEEVEGIMGGGKMTIHTVGHKALGIVHMG
jgi:hypothetical protein